MKVLMPILKLVVYPGLAVMAQRLIVHWGILQTIPYVKHVPTYILMGILLVLKNPLEAWVKDQGA